MDNKSYLKHLIGQSDRRFLRIMDSAFMLRQTTDQIENFETNIKRLEEENKILQQQLKTVDKEAKQQLIAQMKELGAQKNALKNEIAQLVRQSNGLRADLSAMSNAEAFDAKGAGFVEFMLDVTINKRTIYTQNLRRQFEEKIKSYYGLSYLSDYAKQLSREIKLEERSGNIYENMSSLQSFHKRNNKIVQQALQSDLVNENILSYLKKEMM